MSDSTELAQRNEQEAELIAAQQSEFDADSFQTPILKIGQPLTKEVGEGDADVGEFINTLTGDAFSGPCEFIVAYYNKGRFASDKDSGRAFVAFDENIPASWADFVGEEFVNVPFSEYPDSEERFKERVNRKEIEWGNGPPISTTHNYTGLLVVQPVEESDEEAELQPVRLSLQRTNMPAVRKINSIKNAAFRNKPFYDLVFELSTYSKTFNRGTAYLLNVKAGRKTTADEKQSALEVATALRAGRVTSNDDQAGDSPAAPATAPSAEGALDV